MKKKTLYKSYRRRIKGIELYSRIEELMKDPAVFSDPKLSRRSVARLLDSNEKYVREAILDHTGLTFSAYATGIRLDHARRLLLSPDRVYPVDEIARRCGFGISTFYRLFKNDCGMTPEAYRNNMYLQQNQ